MVLQTICIHGWPPGTYVLRVQFPADDLAVQESDLSSARPVRFLRSRLAVYVAMDHTGAIRLLAWASHCRACECTLPLRFRNAYKGWFPRIHPPVPTHAQLAYSARALRVTGTHQASLSFSLPLGVLACPDSAGRVPKLLRVCQMQDNGGRCNTRHVHPCWGDDVRGRGVHISQIWLVSLRSLAGAAALVSGSG